MKEIQEHDTFTSLTGLPDDPDKRARSLAGRMIEDGTVTPGVFDRMAVAGGTLRTAVIKLAFDEQFAGHDTALTGLAMHDEVARASIARDEKRAEANIKALRAGLPDFSTEIRGCCERHQF